MQNLTPKDLVVPYPRWPVSRKTTCKFYCSKRQQSALICTGMDPAQTAYKSKLLPPLSAAQPSLGLMNSLSLSAGVLEDSLLAILGPSDDLPDSRSHWLKHYSPKESGEEKVISAYTSRSLE